MPKNIYPNIFNLSCYNMESSIKPLVWIRPLINGVAEMKNRHLLETARDLLFQMNVPKHFWVDAVSIAYFFINKMTSSVLNWVASYHQLFPIEPKVFGCTCLFKMSVLKSLNLI